MVVECAQEGGECRGVAGLTVAVSLCPTPPFPALLLPLVDATASSSATSHSSASAAARPPLLLRSSFSHAFPRSCFPPLLLCPLRSCVCSLFSSRQVLLLPSPPSPLEHRDRTFIRHHIHLSSTDQVLCLGHHRHARTSHPHRGHRPAARTGEPPPLLPSRSVLLLAVGSSPHRRHHRRRAGAGLVPPHRHHSQAADAQHRAVHIVTPHSSTSSAEQPSLLHPHHPPSGAVPAARGVHRPPQGAVALPRRRLRCRVQGGAAHVQVRRTTSAPSHLTDDQQQRQQLPPPSLPH